MNVSRNSACQTYSEYLLPTLKTMINCLLNLKVTPKIDDLILVFFFKPALYELSQAMDKHLLSICWVFFNTLKHGSHECCNVHPNFFFRLEVTGNTVEYSNVKSVCWDNFTCAAQSGSVSFTKRWTLSSVDFW